MDESIQEPDSNLDYLEYKINDDKVIVTNNRKLFCDNQGCEKQHM